MVSQAVIENLKSQFGRNFTVKSEDGGSIQFRVRGVLRENPVRVDGFMVLTDGKFGEGVMWSYENTLRVERDGTIVIK
jgi:hypothetical protein